MIAPDLINEEDIAKLIIPDDLPDEPAFKAYIEAKVYDKEGHVIQHHRQPMRSLTQYFLVLISTFIVGTYQEPPSNNATSILTNVFGFPTQQSTASNDSANIAWDWSIVLGSGTQTFNVTLNSLAMPIANGSGVGQLIYGQTNVSYAGTSIFISIIVSNYSPTTVNVTEIGLQSTIYIQYYNPGDGYGNNPYSFLLSYDTFSTAISIPPNSLATFQIVLSFTG
jgi:hypothetical protein